MKARNTVTNPFRRISMQTAFHVLVEAYKGGRAVLFTADGKEHRGNSLADMFWRGFHDKTLGAGFTDRASREMLAYAYWRAGQVCAKMHEHAQKANQL